MYKLLKHSTVALLLMLIVTACDYHSWHKQAYRLDGGAFQPLSGERIAATGRFYVAEEEVTASVSPRYVEDGISGSPYTVIVRFLPGRVNDGKQYILHSITAMTSTGRVIGTDYFGQFPATIEPELFNCSPALSKCINPNSDVVTLNNYRATEALVLDYSAGETITFRLDVEVKYEKQSNRGTVELTFVPELDKGSVFSWIA